MEILYNLDSRYAPSRTSYNYVCQVPPKYHLFNMTLRHMNSWIIWVVHVQNPIPNRAGQ